MCFPSMRGWYLLRLKLERRIFTSKSTRYNLDNLNGDLENLIWTREIEQSSPKTLMCESKSRSVKDPPVHHLKEADSDLILSSKGCFMSQSNCKGLLMMITQAIGPLLIWSPSVPVNTE